MKSRPLTCPKCQAGPLRIEAIGWKGKLMCPECDCVLKERKSPLYLMCVIGGVMLGMLSILMTVWVSFGTSRPSWIAIVLGLGAIPAVIGLFHFATTRVIEFETDGHPRCRVCGYDLFAIENGICPECGIAVFSGGRAKV